MVRSKSQTQKTVHSQYTEWRLRNALSGDCTANTLSGDCGQPMHWVETVHSQYTEWRLHSQYTEWRLCNTLSGDCAMHWVETVDSQYIEWRLWTANALSGDCAQQCTEWRCVQERVYAYAEWRCVQYPEWRCVQESACAANYTQHYNTMIVFTFIPEHIPLNHNTLSEHTHTRTHTHIHTHTPVCKKVRRL